MAASTRPTIIGCRRESPAFGSGALTRGWSRGPFRPCRISHRVEPISCRRCRKDRCRRRCPLVQCVAIALLRRLHCFGFTQQLGSRIERCFILGALGMRRSIDVEIAGAEAPDHVVLSTRAVCLRSPFVGQRISATSRLVDFAALRFPRAGAACATLIMVRPQTFQHNCP